MASNAAAAAAAATAVDNETTKQDEAHNNSSLEHLSMMQLQELQGVIKNPIQGRQVMIPLTSQAFAIGSLQPDIQNGEERLLLRQGKIQDNNKNNNNVDEKDMNDLGRQEIYNLLEAEKQRKKKALLESKKSKKKNTSSKSTTPPKSATSPASTSTTKSTPTFQNQSKADTMENNNSNASILPFFEIKEELDDTGNIVKGQAINVTKQLEMVAKQEEAAATESKQEEKEESKESAFAEIMESKPFSPPPPPPPVESTDNPINDEPTTLATVTDQEYQSLSARLDELARLEEEAEAKSKDNWTSSKKLQGNAWSKGFLSGGSKNRNTAPKATSNMTTRSSYSEATSEDESEQQPITPSAAVASLNVKEPSVVVERPIPSKQPPGSSTTPDNNGNATPINTETTTAKTKPKKKSGWSKGFLNTASKTNNGKPQQPSQAKEEGNQDPSKKVSFQSDIQEVREIPRIGNQSVAALRNTNKMNTRPIFPAEAPVPAPSDHVNNEEDEEDRNKKPSPTTMAGQATRPFDSSVFSGVVKERPMSTNITVQSSQPSKKISKFAQERMMATASAPASSQQEESQPKKKLSKFAQERMMMQNR